SVVGEVVLLDDDVPAVEAVLAAVDGDVARLELLAVTRRLHQVGPAAAVDAGDDGREPGHGRQRATTRPESSSNRRSQVWSRPSTCMNRPIDMYLPITSVSSTISSPA